uniref:Serine aminopeptidase S33 domain-containing protein n=1 Tax=Pyramimonas obovata TaxID=1411642 RepID=A0A7S0MWL9_9CHLO|mmetsp:Transcript_14242/g.30504  ORF Transcript_14242/g.30504 Transcript_14242/m.30504 type:complete len:450 (+) Transcript_14242:266-1615(+)|eukprot:CAMPEP_0118927482 /NCGR_PEP_ID=MMETSP1169-20130426/4938_1 /TAXON_ID=36882 /ORGANISM="Pyramimonas obovata, Strain CCMP722" /LENGTH=449 /DNA_ID=CAMNT_0006869243 /DNA_START=240 /DNA_END=1589 /DNA_ORIENTATION=-
MAYIDKTYKALLETCSVSKPKRFFKNGYGDLNQMMKFREVMLSEIAGGTKPHPIDVVWENKEEPGHCICCCTYACCYQSDVLVRKGHFISPSAAFLPEEAKKVYFRFYRPANTKIVSRLVLLFPATGDQFYWYRAAAAHKLAKAGIASIAMTFPFYGKRRPKYQTEHYITTVQDFMASLMASSSEAGSMCRWAAQRYPGVRICLSGISMGGTMSITGAIQAQMPVCVCPCVATPNANSFVHGVLRHSIDWDALIEPKPLGYETDKLVRAEARRKESDKLEKILGLASVPTMLEAAQQHRSGFTKFNAVVQVIAQGDEFVLRDEGAHLAETLRSMTVVHKVVYFDGGHLSFAVLNRGALYTPSIIDTFALADKSESGAHGAHGACPYGSMSSYSPAAPPGVESIERPPSRMPERTASGGSAKNNKSEEEQSILDKLESKKKTVDLWWGDQ